MRKKNKQQEPMPILNAPIITQNNTLNMNPSSGLLSISQYLIDAQMLYNLAACNWDFVLNQISMSNRFNLTPQFIENMSKELNQFFIEKLLNIFNIDAQGQPKRELTNFSENDIQILKVLINQIKNPKKGLAAEEVPQPEIEKPQISVSDEKSAPQPKAPQPSQKRMTISNNVPRKPMPSLDQQRIMAQMEGEAMAQKLPGVYQGVSSQPAKSVPMPNSPANQTIEAKMEAFERDPNQF